VRALEEAQGSSAVRRKLPIGPCEERPSQHSILAQALGGFRDAKLTLQIFRIELRVRSRQKSASSGVLPRRTNPQPWNISMASSFLFCFCCRKA